MKGSHTIVNENHSQLYKSVKEQMLFGIHQTEQLLWGLNILLKDVKGHTHYGHIFTWFYYGA